MPRRKVRLLSLWKMRVHMRFLYKMQQMCIGSWGRASCLITVETAGSQKIPWWKGILICLWKVRVPGRFLDKMQQMSVGSWVKASCLNSVETAGSQKMPCWDVILLYLWKVLVLRRFLDKLNAISVCGKLGDSFLLYFCEECGFSENAFIMPLK